MIAFLGFITVVGMLALIMTKRASPIIALIATPVITALLAAFFITNDAGVVNVLTNILNIPRWISAGIGTVAATGVMFIFSVLTFSILYDAGTFRPIINGVLGGVGGDPIKIALGTALLAMLTHLDGSGATTFLICIPPLLPIYKAVGMRSTTLATIVALAAGTMNMVPWGGPTIRAATAIDITVMNLWIPVIPAQIAGLLCVFIIAFFLGKSEKARLGATLSDIAAHGGQQVLTDEEKALHRPKMFPVNILLLVLMLVALIGGGQIGIGPAVVFMLIFVLVLIINYPTPQQQRERIDANAKAAIMMASVIFAAGAFSGIMRGSGMITEMALALVNLIPSELGRMFPIIVGVISMPASLLFDPDSFYFGVLPTLAATAEGLGVEAINVARSAILGQMTTGFPVSPLTPATFLLVGLAGVEFGEHQKRTIPFAFGITIVMLIVSLITGGIRI